MSDNKHLVTEAEVRKIAHLARLKVDEATLAKYADNLSHILEMIAHINDQDTSNVIAMSSPLDIHLSLRADAVTAQDEHVVLQKLAPQTESGFYLVPQVIE